MVCLRLENLTSIYIDIMNKISLNPNNNILYINNIDIILNIWNNTYGICLVEDEEMRGKNYDLVSISFNDRIKNFKQLYDKSIDNFINIILEETFPYLIE